MTDALTCTSCSSPIAAGLRFCTECGTSAPSTEPIATPIASPSGPAPCSVCGNQVTPGVRFCTECGTPVPTTPPTTPAAPPQPPASVAPPVEPVAPAPAAPTYPAAQPPAQPPGPGASRSGRKTPLIVLGIFAALVLLTGAAFVGAAVLGGDDTTAVDTADATTGTDASDDAADTDAVPSEDGDPSTTAAEPTPTPDPEPGARCWDGSTAPTVKSCSEPTGRAGLRWVYPSIDDADCHPGSASKSIRDLILSCVDYLPDGTEITINYSEWYYPPDAVAHYDEDAYSKDPYPGGRTRWLSIASRNRYKAAIMYTGLRWSVTIYAPTEADRERAERVLVKMRPRTELRGTSL